MTGDRLTGVWDLVALEHQVEDGPWTPAAPSRGRLCYTPDGFVQVLIVILPHNDLPARFADDEVVAYTGRYRLGEDGTVEHLIDIAARPSWFGSLQRRQVAWDGDELVLTTAPFRTSSGLRRSRLRWRRPHVAEG